MKTSVAKTAIIKEVAIVLTCLLLGLAGTAYAGGEESEAKKALHKAEIELLEELNKDFEKDLKELQQGLRNAANDFDRVEIYNMQGDLLKEINLDKELFLEQPIPSDAQLITIDDNVAVYIIF